MPEITVARDYERGAVVVETPDNEQRIGVDAARNMADLIERGSEIPMTPFSGGEALATELRNAADDVEEKQ